MQDMAGVLHFLLALAEYHTQTTVTVLDMVVHVLNMHIKYMHILHIILFRGLFQ